MSFRAILGPNALRQAIRRREDSTTRDQRIVHESTRLVFCVYYGISVSEVRISDGIPLVRYQSEYAFRDSNSLRNCIQMIMSGVIAVQSVLGQENRLFEPALKEAQQLFELTSGTSNESLKEFDDVVSKCSKRAIAQMADPKMRSAMASVTRILIRERSDIRDERLDQLLRQARQKFSV